MIHNQIPDPAVINDYLALFQLSERKFIVGIHQKGITIFRQQVRALNIFETLVRSGKIDVTNKDFSLGIIGGGIAGITIAAAAARMDIKVTIFEQQKIFMHMQYGCETRIVHPYLYEWPEARSINYYAEIPVLPWKTDTASNVTRQLVAAFKDIRTQSKSSEIKSFCSCEIAEIEDNDGKVKIRYNIGGSHNNRVVDLLIFATGYGVEKGVDSESHTPSYWRNDEFGQTVLAATSRKYMISGIGDGGLIDFFRIKILGFSIDSFLKYYYELQHHEPLTGQLKDIRKKWEALSVEKKKNEKGFLRNEFEKIPQDWYRDLINRYILPRINKRAEVTLHGQEPAFEHNWNLDKISLMNAFIAFLMSTRQNLLYKYENAPLTQSRRIFKQNKKIVKAKIIMRRGTNKGKNIAHLLDKKETDQFDSLERIQKNSKLYDTTDFLFGYSSLYSLLTSRVGRYYAFFTPETKSICSSFVSVLAKTMKYHQEKKFPGAKYRICLHRILPYNGSVGYQMVTPYYGDMIYPSSINVGRVFEVTRGIAGMAARTGKIILMQNKNDAGYSKLVDLLGFDAEYRKFGESAIAIPIVGKNKAGENCCNMICFFEADNPLFFTNPELVTIMCYAVEGFIHYINSSLKEKHLVMQDVNFEPLKVNTLEDISSYIATGCLLSQDMVPASAYPVNLPLSFDDFYSFGISYADLRDNLDLYMDENN